MAISLMLDVRMARSGKFTNSPAKGLDQIYSQPREAISNFVFDESVVAVFEDMISRSVPGYSTLIAMLPVFSREYVKENTRCYDLGCSLGGSTLAMQQSINQSGVLLTAIDNSEAMVNKCQEVILSHPTGVDVDVICGDVCDMEITNASMVVMNFTLQFIEEQKRQALLKKIFTGMNEGAAFVLSEKIIFIDEDEQNLLTDLHHAFKKANGYSDLEISQKRSALENVLVPESLAMHKARLIDIGFKDVVVWFQCFNFVSILAVK